MCAISPRNVAHESRAVVAIFFKKSLYDVAMQAVANIVADRHTGVVTADQVKLVLGEELVVWPDPIAPKRSNHKKR
jgi:hypothetical protein